MAFIFPILGSVEYLLVASNKENEFRNITVLTGVFALVAIVFFTDSIFVAAYAVAIGLSLKNIICLIRLRVLEKLWSRPGRFPIREVEDLVRRVS